MLVRLGVRSRRPVMSRCPVTAPRGALVCAVRSGDITTYICFSLFEPCFLPASVSSLEPLALARSLAHLDIADIAAFKGIDFEYNDGDGAALREACPGRGGSKKVL